MAKKLIKMTGQTTDEVLVSKKNQLKKSINSNAKAIFANINSDMTITEEQRENKLASIKTFFVDQVNSMDSISSITDLDLKRDSIGKRVKSENQKYK